MRIPFPGRSVLYLASALTALVAGAFVVHSNHSGTRLVVLLLGGMIVAAIGHRLGRGGIYALLACGAVNLLPGVDTTQEALHGGFFLNDVFTYALAAAMFVSQARQGFAEFRRRRELRWLALWGGVLATAWLLNVLRSWAFDGAVLLHAIRYGEFLLYFALITPLLAASLCDPRVRRGFLIIIGAWTVVIAGALTISNLAPGQMQFLVHAQVQQEQLGGGQVDRTYTLSPALLAMVAVPFGLGACLIGSDRRLRAAGLLIAALCTVATVTSLTRAAYLGLVVSVALPVLIGLIWARRGEHMRRRVTKGAVVIAAAITLFLVVQPPQVANTSLSVITSRVSSIPQTLFSSNAASSTLAYRANEERVLKQYLGKDWPIGLGFMDPRDHFYVGLPTWDGGSIEDTDVGVLNTVMVMGVIGAVIQLAPVLGLLVLLVRQEVLGRTRRELAWIALAGIGALAALCTTAPTLVFFFEPSTIVLCSTVVALGVGVLALGGPRSPSLTAAPLRPRRRREGPRNFGQAVPPPATLVAGSVLEAPPAPAVVPEPSVELTEEPLAVVHVGPDIDSVRFFGADASARLATRRGASPLADARLLSRAARAILAAEPGPVFHFHIFGRASWLREGPLLLLAKRQGHPVVVTLRGADFPEVARLHPNRVAAVLSRADRIRCLSEEAREVAALLVGEGRVVGPGRLAAGMREVHLAARRAASASRDA